jgi:hypothetical protein
LNSPARTEFERRAQAKKGASFVCFVGAARGADGRPDASRGSLIRRAP